MIESALLYSSLEIIADGIQSAPFPDSIYRQVITACTRLCTEITLPKAKMMLLWKETLCWSSLDSHQDTKLIYDYLTNPTTGLLDDGILNQTKTKGEAAISARAYPSPHPNTLPKNTTIEALFRKPVPQPRFSGFLVGPDLTNPSSQPYKVQLVFLTDLMPYLFIVYQWQDEYTLSFLTPVQDGAESISLEYYTHLASSIAHALPPLQALVAQTGVGDINLRVSVWSWDSRTFR